MNPPQNQPPNPPNSNLKRTQQAWTRLSSRLDQLEVAFDVAVRVWWYNAFSAVLIRQFIRPFAILADALTSFAIWAAPDWSALRRTLQSNLVTFYNSLPWDEAIHTIRAWPGLGQLILIAEWYVHAIIELGFVLGNDIRKIRQWSYPKKMIVLYTLVFFFTIFFSPIPPRSPAPTLAVVFASGIGTVYLFSRWLQDWANNGFTRAQ